MQSTTGVNPREYKATFLPQATSRVCVIEAIFRAKRDARLHIIIVERQPYIAN
jgi:hypothetical protein